AIEMLAATVVVAKLLLAGRENPRQEARPAAGPGVLLRARGSGPRGGRRPVMPIGHIQRWNFSKQPNQLNGLARWNRPKGVANLVLGHEVEVGRRLHEPSDQLIDLPSGAI